MPETVFSEAYRHEARDAFIRQAERDGAACDVRLLAWAQPSVVLRCRMGAIAADWSDSSSLVPAGLHHLPVITSSCLVSDMASARFGLFHKRWVSRNIYGRCQSLRTQRNRCTRVCRHADILPPGREGAVHRHRALGRLSCRGVCCPDDYESGFCRDG